MGKRNFKGSGRAAQKRIREERSTEWRNQNSSDNRTANRNSYTKEDGSYFAEKFDEIYENESFENFYRCQMPFLEETSSGNSSDAGQLSDFDNFLQHLKLPLPACFRISAAPAIKNQLVEQLLSFVGQELTIELEENKVETIKAVQKLCWYPNECGYKLGVDRRSIRKLKCMEKFHEWMKIHTENGNITRQEEVSMVPPLALDVKPHHRCLDLCAAPGSKTSQLLEIINSSYTSKTRQGMVVANDADYSRAYMLVHQCKRIQSPLLVVTTHKAQEFPTITDFDGVSSEKGSPFFDRVLADVPCTGDGTMRKNPMIWKKWNTQGTISMHPLQVMIAKRGLQLLKEGGLMTYSTCSISPYEDEAVVAELLRWGKLQGMNLQLVDPRHSIPLFKCRRGISNWHVLDDITVPKRDKSKEDTIISDEKEKDKVELADKLRSEQGLYSNVNGK